MDDKLINNAEMWWSMITSFALALIGSFVYFGFSLNMLISTFLGFWLAWSVMMGTIAIYRKLFKR